MKKILNNIITVILIISVLFSTESMNVHASNPCQKQILTEEEFADILLKDEKLREHHESLLEEGYIFVSAEEQYVYGNARGLTANGKVVETTYKQPTKRTVVYNEDIYNSIADLNTPIQITLGLLPPYVWIPVTLFGISTSNFSDYLSTGRQEMVADARLYCKTAYYYDASSGKYWCGYEAQKLVTAATFITYYEVDGKPFHKSHSEHAEYLSPNYNNDAYLDSMAKIHWDDDVYSWETYALPEKVEVTK